MQNTGLGDEMSLKELMNKRKALSSEIAKIDREIMTCLDDGVDVNGRIEAVQRNNDLILSRAVRRLSENGYTRKDLSSLLMISINKIGGLLHNGR